MTASSPPIAGRCQVRAVRDDDLESVVDIELRSFNDVYGDDPPAQTRAEVRSVMAARMAIVGDWFRVLEDFRVGPIGLLIGCPTEVGPERMSQLQGGRPEVLRAIHDPGGSRLYVVDLAVDKSRPSPGRALDLLADCRRRSQADGIRTTTFRSRISGLAAWVRQEQPGIDLARLTVEEERAFAGQYVEAVVSAAQGSPGPTDPALSLYLGLGARPWAVVDGWDRDHVSLHKGVLCIRDVPYPAAPPSGP